MKIVSSTSIAPYTTNKDEKQSKNLKKQQSNDCDTIEISSKQEKTTIDDNTSYVISLKEFIKNNSKNSALSEILKNTSKPKKYELSAKEIQKICIKIASRIKKGDKVPLKDLQYLLKKDPQLYQMAMVSIKPNDDPKKCEQLSPDEEQDSITNSLNAVAKNLSIQTTSNDATSSQSNK